MESRPAGVNTGHAPSAATRRKGLQQAHTFKSGLELRRPLRFNNMPPEPNTTIQGLWIGPELSVMERLSICSFLRHGHDYHLYVYEEVKNVPAGAVIMDASEILPAARIFQYKRSPSYAGFSNYFRYKLLFERGGWWADSDTVCLKPFDFAEEYVFATEINYRGREGVASCVIKAPAGSKIMAYAWGVCQTKNPDRLMWGETGPKLMNQAVKKLSLQQYKQTPEVFCPIDYEEWRAVLTPGFEKPTLGPSYAIHLWNEMWRAAGQDKNAQYHPNSLYEELKRRYLPVITTYAPAIGNDIMPSAVENQP